MANDIAGCIFVEPVLDADIGGTSATTETIDMTAYDRVAFVVQLGDSDGDGTFSNWHASDELDSCIVQECTASDGTGATTLSDQSAVVDATAVDATAGDRYLIEVRASSVSDGYPYVRLYLAEGGNSGTDNVHVTAIGIRGRYVGADESSMDATALV